MWTIISRLFSVKSKPTQSLLPEILALEANREVMLGLRQIYSTNEKVIEQSAGRTVRHSSTEEYASWAKEIWASVNSCVDVLTRNNLPQHEADFYRGMLAANLDALRISYRARSLIEQKQK